MLYHGPARADCEFSSSRELLEDPLPRLPLLLVYPQALLLNLVPWDILLRAWTMPLVLTATSVIVAACIGIAVVQTVIIADCSRTRSRCHSSAAMPKSGSRNIAARGMCLRVQWQSRRATSREPGRGMLADAGQKE